MKQNGQRLDNGAIQIASERSATGDTYVLAMWQKDGKTEYITWFMDTGGGCSHGHYHFDILKASKDLMERAGKAPIDIKVRERRRSTTSQSAAMPMGRPFLGDGDDYEF